MLPRPKFRSGVFFAPHHNMDEDPTILLRRDLEMIEWLDQLGFEEAWIGEHHSGGFECIASPELMLAAAAERTKRIMLGTGVISLPYHNPLMVANRMIQLDHMTMGRTIFGVGPGLLTSDAMMLGIDPSTQRERMVESLEVILRLFAGETVSYECDWFTLKNAHLHLMPFSSPRMEVAVASSLTPSGARAAGRLGLSMLCVAATDLSGYDALTTNWEIAKQIGAENGNTMDLQTLRLMAPMHIAETREQARKNVEFGLERWFEYTEGIMPGRYGDRSVKHPVDFINDSGLGVIGTPDDAIALIERLQKKQGEFGTMLLQGIDWADWNETKRSYELYARHVVPHMRRANVNRAASKDWVENNNIDFTAQRKKAVDAMFAKHESDRSAKQSGA